MGRYAPTDKSHMPELVRLLAEWGVTAEPGHLGDELIALARIRVDYDLYVLKDKSELAMRVAAALHTAGAALLNPYPASATLRDRIVKLRVLQAAGVPAPKTFVASHVDQLRAALEHGPLVIKPRSEEHTSELQSRQYIVCRLLLEKKKTMVPETPMTHSASTSVNSRC